MKLHSATLCLLPLLVVPPALVGQGPPQPNPQQPTQKVTPMLLPQSVVLPRDGADIVIDGTLGDWPSLPAIVLADPRQLSGTAPGAWRGQSDCAAYAFALWDEENFYINVSVSDEWHRALDEKSLQVSEIPLADSVLLSFDPQRDTRAGGPSQGRREDREFWLADEAGREVVQWDRLRGSARKLPVDQARVVCLHDKEHGVTTYEAKLPWSEILPSGQLAKTGKVIDFQIVVSDFDESTDPMPQTRIGWTFGCGPIIDPGLFGSLMLVGDRAALQGMVPEFAAKPAADRQPLGSAEQWHDLTASLLRLPPAVHDGSLAPEQAGGLQRFKVLEAIDQHCDAWPRIDFVEYHNRVNRRMRREVAGIRARGLPFWWSSRLQGMSRAAEDPVPEGAVRFFRVPAGGWLIATAGGGFGIDPAGADVEQFLWGRMGFALLTQPLDATRRNDQLLMRMLGAKPPRPVLTHIVFHLPMVRMGDMPLVTPGADCSPPQGMKLLALGRPLGDGHVSTSCSYRIELDSGPRIMVVAPSLEVADVGEGPIDVMLLSPHNPNLLQIVEKVKPGLIVIDDVFRCQAYPGVPRMSLKRLHSLQKALQPVPSLILAPGESWDVTRV